MDKRRLTAAERDVVMRLSRITDMLWESEEQTNRTVSRYKYGKRDIALLKNTAKRLLKEICLTAPNEQLITIERQLQANDLKEVPRKPIGKVDEFLYCLPASDFVRLANWAITSTCMRCDGNQKNCEMQRILKDAPIEVIHTYLVPCMGGI